MYRFLLTLYFGLFFQVLFAQEVLEEFFPYTQSFSVNNIYISEKHDLSVLGNGRFGNINEFTLKVSEDILKEYYSFVSPEEDYSLRIIVYPSLYSFLKETPYRSLTPFWDSKQPQTLRVFFTGNYLSYYLLLRRALADFISNNLFLQAELWNKINYNQIPRWEIYGTSLFLSQFTHNEQAYYSAFSEKIPELSFSKQDRIPYPKYLFTALPLQFVAIRYGYEKTKDIVRVLKLTANFKTLLYIVSTGIYKDFPYYSRFIKAVKNPSTYASQVPGVKTTETLKKIPVENIPLGFATDKNHKFTAYAFLEQKHIVIKVFSYEKNKSAVIGKFKLPAPLHPHLFSFLKIPLCFFENKIYLADFQGNIYVFDIAQRKWEKIIKRYFYSVWDIYTENGNLVIEGFNGKNTGAFVWNARKGKLTPLAKNKDNVPLTSISLPAYISYYDSVKFTPYSAKLKLLNKDSVLVTWKELPKNFLLKARNIGENYLSLHYFPDLRGSCLLLKNNYETKIISEDSSDVLDFFTTGQEVFYYTFSGKELVIKKADFSTGVPIEKIQNRLPVNTRLPELKTRYYEEEKKAEKKNPLQYYVFDDEETEEYFSDSTTQDTSAPSTPKNRKLKKLAKHFSNGAELLDASANIGLDPYYRLYFHYDLVVSDIFRKHIFTLSHNIFSRPKNQDISVTYYYNRFVPKLFVGGNFTQRVETEYAVFKFRRSEIFAGAFYRFGNHRLEGRLAYNVFRKIDVKRYDILDFSSKDNVLLPQIQYTFNNIGYAYRAPVKGNFVELKAKYFLSLQEKLSFYTLQFTTKKYLRLVPGIVLATQGKGGISAGATPQTFLLGGTQEWLNYQFQYKENLPFNASASSFLMMEYITPVRGFPYNSRNGSKYLLLNSELRFYTAELFGSSFPSRGVNKFIFSLFYDVGTAWTYGNPLSQKNPVNKTEIDSYPLLITVENFKNPFIISTGVANTLNFSSLTLRYSLAWLIEDNQLTGTFFTFGFGKDF